MRGMFRLLLTGFLLILTVSVSAAQTQPDVLLQTTSDPFTAVIVEKSTQRLWVFHRDEAGNFVARQQFDCSTGEVRGDKLVAGDKKTPEGVYFFLTEYPDKYLAPIYGTGAFPIDYPNVLDRRAGKTGSAIWLHGTNKVLKPQDTNGCVALENTNLDRMRGDIRLFRTPMVIVEKLNWREGAAPDADGIRTLLERWHQTLASGTYQDYLQFYSPDYLPEIDWWPFWQKEKNRLKADGTPFTLTMRGLDLFRTGNRVTAVFEEEISAGNTTRKVGIRKLFLEPVGDRGLAIVGEAYLFSPETPKKEEPSLLASIQKIETTSGTEKEITTAVDAWITAWAGGDITAYASFYAEDFHSQGRNRREWIRYKERLNRQYSFIRVRREGPLDIRMRDAWHATVRFPQYYASSGFEARGRKRLDLVREGGKWMIFKESWKKQ